MERALSDEEKRLCKIGLAHAILRTAANSSTHPEKKHEDYDITKAISEWREAYPIPIPNTDRPRALAHLESLACLPLDSGILRSRFLDLARSSLQDGTITVHSFTTWIPVRGWELVTSLDYNDSALVRTMHALRLLSRLDHTTALAPAILCGLHALASRMALELVDASDNRICLLVGQTKPILDAFGDIMLLLALDLRGASRRKALEKDYADAVALSEMLARLVLDFEHVPLAHAYLVLLSEQILPVIAAPPPPVPPPPPAITASIVTDDVQAKKKSRLMQRY